MAVNYAALAKQARGSSAPPPVDYAALAAQARQGEKSEPGIADRFMSRNPLGMSGVSQVPGALMDLAASGPSALPTIATSAAGVVGDMVAGQNPVDLYNAARERGQSKPYSALASIPFLGPVADVVTQDVVQGRIPELAADALNLAPMALGPLGRVSNRLGQSATNSAQKSMSQTLGATTKDLKRLSEQVVPELVKREPVALTRKSLLDKVRTNVDDSRANLDDALAKVPPHLKVDLNKAYAGLDDLKTNHQMQNAAGELVPANPAAAATVKAIDSLQQSLLELDPSFGSVRKFRQILDKQVTAGGKTFGRTISEGTVLDVTREGANVIRNVLAEATPNISKLNKELSFWLNAKQILGATVERTASQATPLGVTIAQGAGLAGGLAAGGGVAAAGGLAVTLGAVKTITQSTGWRTSGILVKNRLARALMNGDQGEIMAVGRFVTKRPILLAKPQPSPEP